jgi:hypothetical protein
MYIIIIAAFTFAYYFINAFNGHIILKRIFKIPLVKRFRPFDCIQCLTVWSALAFTFLPIHTVETIAVIFAAGFISIKIK